MKVALLTFSDPQWLPDWIHQLDNETSASIFSNNPKFHQIVNAPHEKRLSLQRRGATNKMLLAQCPSVLREVLLQSVLEPSTTQKNINKIRPKVTRGYSEPITHFHYQNLDNIWYRYKFVTIRATIIHSYWWWYRIGNYTTKCWSRFANVIIYNKMSISIRLWQSTGKCSL